MKADLAARRAEYETALNNVYGDMWNIQSLDISDSKIKEFYDNLLAEDQDKVNVLQSKITEILNLQTFTIKFYSLIYTIKPDTIQISGSTTVFPRIRFNAFYKNGEEATEEELRFEINGLTIKYEHDGEAYDEISRKGRYHRVKENMEVRIKNADERDTTFQCPECNTVLNNDDTYCPKCEKSVLLINATDFGIIHDEYNDDGLTSPATTTLTKNGVKMNFTGWCENNEIILKSARWPNGINIDKRILAIRIYSSSINPFVIYLNKDKPFTSFPWGSGDIYGTVTLNYNTGFNAKKSEIETSKSDLEMPAVRAFTTSCSAVS